MDGEISAYNPASRRYLNAYISAISRQAFDDLFLSRWPSSTTKYAQRTRVYARHITRHHASGSCGEYLGDYLGEYLGTSGSGCCSSISYVVSATWNLYATRPRGTDLPRGHFSCQSWSSMTERESAEPWYVTAYLPASRMGSANRGAYASRVYAVRRYLGGISAHMSVHVAISLSQCGTVESGAIIRNGPPMPSRFRRL